eukprot:2747803-Rhodomonas_salina.2
MQELACLVRRVGDTLISITLTFVSGPAWTALYPVLTECWAQADEMDWTKSSGHAVADGR